MSTLLTILVVLFGILLTAFVIWLLIITIRFLLEGANYFKLASIKLEQDLNLVKCNFCNKLVFDELVDRQNPMHKQCKIKEK